MVKKRAINVYSWFSLQPNILEQLVDLIPEYDRLLVNLPGHWKDKDSDYSYESYLRALCSLIEILKGFK